MTDVLHTVSIDASGPVVLAVVAGEIDASNASAVASELSTAGDRRIVIDLTDVRYLDSAGVAMLDGLRRTRELILVVPEHSIVQRTMQIVGFDKLVPFCASIDDALANAAKPEAGQP